MAITFQGSQVGGTTSTSTSLTAAISLLNTSGGAYTLQQDDFCVLFWSASEDSARTSQFEARRALDGTWTQLMTPLSQLDTGSPGNTVTIGAYYKFQGATPDSVVPIPGTVNGNGALAWDLHVFKGVNSGSVINASNGITGTNTGRPNPPAATSVDAGGIAVVMAGTSCGSSQGAVYIRGADISATTNHFRSINQNGSSKDCTCGVGLILGLSSSAFVDPVAWTGNSTDSDSAWGAYTVILQPDYPDILPSATNQNQAENAAFSQVYTADIPVTWSLVGGTDQAKFTMNSSTGELTMPAKDYEAPDDADANRVYNVTIRATDSANALIFTDKAVTVTITNVGAPTIGPATTAYTVAHNTAFSSDHTPNTATWSIVGGADAAKFAITSPAGLLSMTAKDFFNPTDDNADGVYECTIRAVAAGGEGQTDKSLTVTVLRPQPFATAAVADNSGTHTGSWANLNLLYADDTTYATYNNCTTGQTTDTVTASGFDLSWLPDGSTILGIEVLTEVDPTSSSGTSTGYYEFGVKTGTPKQTASYDRNGVLTALTLGGPTDTWGLSGADLTGVGLKSSFGVTLKGIANAGGTGSQTFRVDYIAVRIYFNPSTVLTSTDLATPAASVSQATLTSFATLTSQTIATPVPALSTASLGQIHNLIDLDLVTSAPILLTGNFGQKHNITASTLATPGVSITQAAFGQKHILSAGVLATTAPAISQSAVASFAVLVTTNLTTSIPAITSAVFGQKHILTDVDFATFAPSITNATLVTIRVLTSTNLSTTAPSITNATLVTVRVLTSTNVATPAALISNATIGQKHNLADIDVVTSAAAIDSATIGQKHIMAVQNITTFQPAITQVAALGIVNFIAQNVATPAALISNATIEVIPTVIKIIRPESTTATGGWTDELGGTNLAGSLDEAVANDSDYARSGPNPTNDICRIKLQDLQATAIYAPAKLRYRLHRVGTGPGPDQTVRLFSGGNGTIGTGTLVGSWTHDVAVLTTFEQTVNVALIDPEAPLYLELEAA